MVQRSGKAVRSMASLGLALAAAASAARASSAALGARTSCAECLLAPLKDVLAGILWFAPLLRSRVMWRGNALIVRKDSVLAAPAGRRARGAAAPAAVPEPFEPLGRPQEA